MLAVQCYANPPLVRRSTLGYHLGLIQVLSPIAPAEGIKQPHVEDERKGAFAY